MAPPTVRDLLDTPHLRLRLRAGGVGLDRPVTWAQTSDLTEPWSYLAGGELLMKNGQTLPEPADGQVALIEGLAENGMCGMVIGLDAATPELTTEAIALADRLGFPIMVAPYSVGFASIGRAVADAAGSGRVAVTERVYNVIRQSVSHSGPANVLAQLERDLACRIAVLDAATGTVALEASKPPPTDLRRVITSEITERGGAIPGVLHVTAGAERALVVEVPDEEPTILATYAFRGPTTDMVHLQHLASAVAVLLAQQNARREHERRIGAEVMGQLCDGRMSDRDGDRELGERGLNAATCCVVAADGVSSASERQLHLGLGRRSVPHLLLRRAALLYALMPVTDRALDVLSQRLGEQATLGISEPLSRPSRAPDAVREATWAVRVAVTASHRSARFADATMFSVLRDPEEARVVVDRVLGKLIDYDATHSSDMLTTLDTYLRCQRSWLQTAAELGIHRQTVVYRIQRVEEITGRRIADTATLAEFWLALRARDLLAVPS
ncbi:PucR family transcriptional regulator [Mycolicibacterium sp. 120270]|uniref:PucR family transcriptional regulator n=1 Tax=Mycolicibacterium sp. 120270 TaxID=3090600 RepID=UPI00299F0712|nr:PucR family transcriptional regulator ligand-binding domain-containing protein [Mycolicibacterium sp. 120270]MDX1882946.1 PucR family transcriptional regulator ligand-binding domain-containing protein [Mycolicibacterium sp. 120270]